MITAVTAFDPAENAALCKELELPFPLLSDPEGKFFALLRESGIAADRTLLFDSILRLEEVVESGGEGHQAEAALAWARARARPLETVTAQAPVLVLANVLDADFCRRLIAFWENNEQFEGGISSDRGASGIQLKAKTKIRRDVILPNDTPEGRELIAVLERRLLPEILKAFSFRTTGFEAFRIGCYDAADGGHFAAHRDNVVPQGTHRRFAVSFTLNDGFEGGGLRLPEFGPQIYALPPGGAVVFSCSLLHLVTPMVRGRRFGLFLFLAGPEQTAGMEGSARQG
jgi:predicted 2-oxoglutarate/Fe(II)-dependent dioxygenase YbiX